MASRSARYCPICGSSVRSAEAIEGGSDAVSDRSTGFYTGDGGCVVIEPSEATIYVHDDWAGEDGENE